MLLTVSTTMQPATDLGFLLHKHPDKAQQFDLPVGTAHVVWPEASEQRATAALLLEVDPLEHGGDRPYAASSLLAVALGNVFRTGLQGRCKARPELVEQPIPLEIRIPALPGGVDLVERLFAPLGWQVQATPVSLDEQWPSWGESRFVDTRLTGTLRLADALSSLYVLLPVLDGGSKHYWVGEEEVEKLLRAGGSWLPTHPERELITRRYLKHDRELLAAVGALPAEPTTTPLVRIRRDAVLAALRAEHVSSVVDLGCGEGALLKELLGDIRFSRVVGVDVSARSLELAEKRLGLERMPDLVRSRLELFQSSVTYRDDRLAGHDAIVLVEVVEHVDPPRLPALERNVFSHARPTVAIVTTPNAEFNLRYPKLHGGFRHPDHRFEWTRAEFAAWAAGLASEHGYVVRHEDVGEVDPELGPPTQMAVFRRVA